MSDATGAMLYMQLLQQGVPNAEAFKQAFPNGIPTAQDRAKDLAKAQQKAGYGQLGGMVAGALGSKAIYDAVTGKPILGGIGSKLSSMLGLGGDTVGVGPVASGSEYAASLTPGASEGLLTSAAPYLGGAAALYGGYNLAKNFGHEGLAGGAISGAGTGAGIGTMILPGPGTAVGAGVGALLGAGLSLFDRKTTKQIEQDRWKGLNGGTSADAAFQANHPTGDTGVWQTGEFAGKKWNFEDAKTLAEKDPTQFRHVYGNYDTFGNDWSKYSPDQQNKIVSGLLNAGLYKSDHGDIIITNKDQANQIRDSILNPQPAQPQSNAYNRANLKQTGQFGNQLLQALGS